MAIQNPKGRANYEPNSWGSEGGPREHPSRGFRSHSTDSEGAKTRLRPESFADHYSQARLFYRSQTPVEQKHVADALVFELSRCERADIRERMTSHLAVIDETLAVTVAGVLGIEVPEPAEPAKQPIDLPTSDVLSIIVQGPKRFEGRKLGIYLSDGADAKLYKAALTAVKKAAAVHEVVAPKIAGATLSDGTLVEAHYKIDGGPSVLFDAVMILTSEESVEQLTKDAPSQDFVRDAFAHCKFIAYAPEAMPLIEKAGIADDLDEGCVEMTKAADIASFIEKCGELRVWAREQVVDLDS